MILLLQAAPLLLLLGLLVSGRAGPVPAVLAALAAAVPAVLAALPEAAALPGFLAEEAARGAFLALKPVGVVTGGLLVHAAISPRPASARGDAARPASARRAFVATLLAGAFLESVTGFGVGAVFALSALRAMGIGGAPAGAMALMGLSLVPWGGLGPGTALGAVLIGTPPQALAAATAAPNAAFLLLLGPVFWRLCAAAGLAVTPRERLAQTGYLAAMAAILLAAHRLAPFEVAGVLAAGLPLLVALWRLDPPRDAAARAAALRRLAPHALLTLALLGARSLPGAPEWRPFADLPGFPATHVAVVLWLFGGAWLLARGRAGLAAGAAALRRGARPALAMLLYVVLARWLAGAGIAAALADAAAASLGPAAPFLVPPLGLLAGMVTGSNVASNAALTPVQAALGAAAGLPPLLAPALHNFAGSAGVPLSFATTALVCGLLADGTRPAGLWRLLGPWAAAVLAVGWAALLFGR